MNPSPKSGRAPAVYRPQGAPVQRKQVAPAVYRPQPAATQAKAGPAVYRPNATAAQPKMAAPAVYRPQPVRPAALRNPMAGRAVQPMASSSWRALGAAGGFVGAAGLAFFTAPLTLPTLAAVGIATGLTAAVAPAIGRGIEGRFGPRRVEPTEPPPPSREVAVSSPPVTSSSSSSSSSSRDQKREEKGVEEDFFAGALPDAIRVDLRAGPLTASGEHHKDFEFRFEGTRQTERYNLDPWIVGHKAIAQPRGQRQLVLDTVGGWACNDSIVNHIVNRVILTAPSGDVSQGTVSSAQLRERGSRSFVLHLLALRGNVADRIADVPANCPSSIMIVSRARGGPEPENVQINWAPILKNGRERVKANILAGQRCPAKDAVLCAHQALAAAVQPGLATLRAYGFLSPEGEFSSSSGGRKMQTQKSLNFAIGHLRFILYLEWRAVDELIAGN